LLNKLGQQCDILKIKEMEATRLVPAGQENVKIIITEIMHQGSSNGISQRK
jgi:hypothetical protein